MTGQRGLAAVLDGLGVRRGGVLLVHASLRGSGLRDTEVVASLLDALGPEGTLVVPAFTPENSDTSRQYRTLTEGMTEEERAAFRESMLPFEPESTPCPSMGRLAERVRTFPGAVRSVHPQTSFAALGARAAELLGGHDPHCHLGEHSPLARLYESEAQVLLLRVGFEVCSAFHLAEYRLSPPVPMRTYRCVTERKGHWTAYRDIVLDDGDFAAVGAALPRGLLKERDAGGKPAVLFGLREAVDHALGTLTALRR
ncbi:AAC(3) family N-acetyltransferase [Streptomyces sp. GC420]|uniref:AAC(3) family N-acetyltransferase n=1 Tax=Streptomyces sp. GC420 TaxID=2697568 RepID=UPI001414D626|nr:AAC(3) family N-acetyltransferase [Streptomyces sp. GC420]NBM17052.1 aminoglycoside N(3)-acetyltransferase [Streptomyces sp. GC420]